MVKPSGIRPPAWPPAPEGITGTSRRPETTTPHHIVRGYLETHLALVHESDPMSDGVPDHVEKEFRSYLRSHIPQIEYRISGEYWVPR